MASRDIIVIGGSLGAVDALRRVCADLPSDLPAAVFVVMHFGQHDWNPVSSLQHATALRVVVAQNGAPVERGIMYAPPPAHHLLVIDGAIRLGRGPRENMARLAIDPLFRSAAVSYGPRVIGLVLTGMLNDGAAGLAAVQQCGGVTVVQNLADARAASMPLGALQTSDVDYRATAGEFAREPAGPSVPVPPEIGLEVEIALGSASDTPTLRKIGNPVELSCPSCGGVLSEIDAKPPLRFRCQVGHAFAADVLEREQHTPLDLRVALRVIEERATLADSMAADAGANGVSEERIIV
jgi:two-component system chemotaxis response regulator CheB